jgi:hypothetical protein
MLYFVFMGFVWFSLWTVITSLNSVIQFIFVMVKCVDCILKYYLDKLWFERVNVVQTGGHHLTVFRNKRKPTKRKFTLTRVLCGREEWIRRYLISIKEIQWKPNVTIMAYDSKMCVYECISCSQCNNVENRNIFQLQWEHYLIIFQCNEQFCFMQWHTYIYLPMWDSHYFITVAKQVWSFSISREITSGNTGQSMVVTAECKVPNYLILAKYCFIWFLIWLSSVKGSNSQCLHKCMLTIHVEMVRVRWESGCSDETCTVQQQLCCKVLPTNKYCFTGVWVNSLIGVCKQVKFQYFGTVLLAVRKHQLVCHLVNHWYSEYILNRNNSGAFRSLVQ